MAILIPTMTPKMISEVNRVQSIFSDADAQWVEAPTLLSAQVMLDLYGEAIRDHAYIIHDAVDGDFVLRPDFTVPLVEAHMNEGAEPARYAYSGRVWRKRESGEHRHSFWQMGFELFDRGDVAKNDAEIFALASSIASEHSLSAQTGDLGLIFAALDLLDIAPWRKAALRRHVWRPRAFLRLLEQFSSDENKHSAWLDGFAGLNARIPDHGLRTKEMVTQRIERLKLEAQTPAIPASIKTLLLALFDISGSLKSAENSLESMVKTHPILKGLAAKFASRNEALADAGIDPSIIAFDAGFGRESMEYYDGFVFGFKNASGKIAISGGRYDSLTEILGAGRKIPAIGLACFPELFMGECT